MLILTVSLQYFWHFCPRLQHWVRAAFSHRLYWPLRGWAGLPCLWWPGKSHAQCRLLLGGGEGQLGNSPQDCQDLLSQNSPRVPEQPEGEKTARRCSHSSLEEPEPSKQGWAHPSAQPLDLEARAQQWEAANTNFLKVNTYNYILADISKAA